MLLSLPNRRRFLHDGSALAISLGFPPVAAIANSMAGRLDFIPRVAGQGMSRAKGLQKLGFGQGRDGLLFLPSLSHASVRLPLLVMLHGAGGAGEQVMPMVQALAERHKFVVLAPDSRDPHSWDVIHGEYGPDITFLNRALGSLLDEFAIDAKRIAIGGFSDGASYALSVGLINGDLFGHVLGFSPGFSAATEKIGKPHIFISHGNRDEVLPVERCGRKLAGELAAEGYDVDYREFAGGHLVPPDMAAAGVARFLGAGQRPSRK